MELEPITPERAVELYLSQRETEVTQATLYSHKSRLGHFVRWCDEQNIENLNTITGRNLYEYRIWRREDGNLSKVTEKTQMDTLRVFIRWLESIEAVQEDLHIKVQSPSLGTEDNVREATLTAEQAEKVLRYLEKYEYASLPHVVLSLLWHTMMRRGSARALDVNDYYSSDQYLEVTHRPDTETPLKNQEKGERLVALSEKVSALLDDWVAEQRPTVTDDYGRQPLLATRQGRVHYGTIQQYVYQFTRSCIYSSSCPHDREQASCEATNRDSAAKCPSSVSPHAVRRGAITYSLQSDIPETAVSDRADVSSDVLDKHYDKRAEREKMEQRRHFVNRL